MMQNYNSLLSRQSIRNKVDIIELPTKKKNGIRLWMLAHAEIIWVIAFLVFLGTVLFLAFIAVGYFWQALGDEKAIKLLNKMAILTIFGGLAYLCIIERQSRKERQKQRARELKKIHNNYIVDWEEK